jgi:hypothetical protein
MGTGTINDETMLALGLAALVVLWLNDAYIFRDSLGIIVFLVLGIETLVQLFRVVVLGGKRKTLKRLWSAFWDAFWGIG